MNLQKQQGRVSKMCNANNVIPTRRFFSLLRIILFLFLSLFCISACNAPAAAPSAPLPGAAAAVTPESVGKVKSEAASEIIPGAVNETAAEPTEKTAAQFTEEAMPKTEEYQLLLEQFFDDAHVPDTMWEQFAQAIYGSAEAQTWLDEYNGDYLDWSLINAVLPSRDGNYPYAENECLYNIGMFYYSGEDFINFKQDRIKAFEWFLLSADAGNAPGAIQAGDMARDGDGTTADPETAFRLYRQAADSGPNSTASERLGDCYLDGTGTTADRQKAFTHYLDSALMGHAPALYKLSAFAEDAPMDLTALYKAASMQNYDGGYLAMAYGGLADNTPDLSKTELMEKLIAAWNRKEDAAARNLQATVKSIKSAEYFPDDFVTALTQTVYAYSYHTFADQYGLRTNLFYEDAQTLQLAPEDTEERFDEMFSYKSAVTSFLEYEGCEFYKYDFDGCGTDEIGIPVNTGIGGAFMADSFVIYKQTEEGLVYFTSDSESTFRDAMRIIQYDGRVYFIANQFDDTGNAPHDIMASTIDPDGRHHTVQIHCKDYSLRHVITSADEAYGAAYDAFFSTIERQGREAVTTFKQQKLYSPGKEKRLPNPPGGNYWWNRLSSGPMQQDVFFIADLDNNGTEKVIHKGRSISQTKYYDDYQWFQIYESRTDFDNGSISVKSPDFHDDFYGLHSGGNLYDLLPLGSHVVQFWTQEHDGITYCISLQKHELLYTLQIYTVQNGEAGLVRKSLFIDEAQNVEISFWGG